MANILVSEEEFEGLNIIDYVEEEHVKHDVTSYTVVFKKDDKYYITSYEQSYNYGIDEYQFPLTACEVREVEVTKLEWRPV